MGMPLQIVESSVEQEAILDDIPVGFRFVPTNEELVCSYLVNKVTHKPLPSPIIKEIGMKELYRYAPLDLPAMDLIPEYERYFFTPWNTQLHDGRGLVRKSGFGFWKPSGIYTPIYDSTGEEVAVKHDLVFFQGNSLETAKETEWVMEEFLLPGHKRSNMKKTGDLKDDWVLCRIQIWGASTDYEDIS